MLPFVRLLSLVVFIVALAETQALAQQTADVGPNYETRLSAIEDQMRTLNGRIEQLEFNVRRLDQTLQRMQGDSDARLTKVENEVTALQQSPPPQTAPPVPTSLTPQPSQAAPQDPAPNGTLGAIKFQDGKIVGGINSPQSPALPDTPADYGLTAQEQYDRAFGLLRQANYDEAEKAFKEFIDKNPKDKLLDNAKYWYGETLYVRGRFDESAIAFADAYQQNPQGAKAPDSLLKLAMSLGALQKPVDACTALVELKNKYPNASATVRARADEQRAKLKCGAP